RRHQARRAGLLQGVPETVLQLLGGGSFKGKALSHPAGQRQEFRRAQMLEQPAVAGQHDGQQDVGIELNGGEQAQLREHDRAHLLRLVDEQHRSGECGIDVGLPALPQHGGAGPAIMRMQADPEEFAHLAVEVGDVGLRTADHTDPDIALRGKVVGEQAHGGGFAAPGHAGEQGKSALFGLLRNAPAERSDGRGGVQPLDRRARRKRVPSGEIYQEVGHLFPPMVLNVPCSWLIPSIDPRLREGGGGMVFRTAGAIAALLIGLGTPGGEALAQYYPPAQASPPPQAYPPPHGYRPSVADADDNQLSDLQGRPLPPAAVGPQATEPAAPAPRYGNTSPVYPDEAALPPPPGAYREPPPAPYGYERPAAATQPDATRPPLPLRPGQIGAGPAHPQPAGAAPHSHP